MALPGPETGYLRAVVVRLRELLGDRLVGVYPTGSVALDGYQPGRSDIDLIAVAERPPVDAVQAIVAALSHEALPCPATGLEFVLYDRAVLGALATGAGFALNLNTGRELPALVQLSPGDEPASGRAGSTSFWYPIDRDIAQQTGQALAGPPLARLATRLAYPVLLPVVIESIAVHRETISEHGDNAVLNGCRALRFCAERRWAAKPEAAAWALDRADGFGPLIAAAAATHRQSRAAGGNVGVDEARDFLGYVLNRMRG